MEIDDDWEPEAAAPRFVAGSSWRRALAGLLDLLPMMTLWLLIASAVAAGSQEPVPTAQWNLIDQVVDYIHARPSVVRWSLIFLALLSWAWPFFCQVAFGRTPGKRVLGLRLVDAHGQRPSPGRSCVHCLLRLVSITALGAGWLWSLADPDKRTLHDRAAGIWIVGDERRRPH